MIFANLIVAKFKLLVHLYHLLFQYNYRIFIFKNYFIIFIIISKKKFYMFLYYQLYLHILNYCIFDSIETYSIIIGKY